MRLILLGGGSFIARAMAAQCVAQGLQHVTLQHSEDARAILRDEDRLINFAISPHYRTQPYDEAQDFDLAAARAAADRGAYFLMLSTRRVYPDGHQWAAREDSPADGDATAYGRNKAISEQAVKRLLADRAGIFRLSNIFGYEYNSSYPRPTFLGRLLHTLKQKNEIVFDMHPATRRDFLPVEICARLLSERAAEATGGTFNLGSGIALACGTLADWIMQGYGGGRLVSTRDDVRDEFYLDMDKWRSRFALPVDKTSLRSYATKIGEALKCEKS